MEYISRLLLFCLYVTVASSHRDFDAFETHPHLFDIQWRNFLRQCSCTNDTLDCSQRGKATLSVQDHCEGYVVANMAANSFVNFPDGLQQAKIVKISENNLNALPTSVHLNSEIRELYLGENLMTNASTELKSLMFLEVLGIDRNLDIQHLRFLPDPCSLRQLNVSRNNIESLDGPLKNCTRMEELDLSRNKLAYIPEDIFATMTELKILDLSSNRLSSLASNTFTALNKLRILSLRGYKSMRDEGPFITQIPDGLFNSLTVLEYLDLSYNSLTTISSAAFSAMSNLKILDLSSNEISTFPTDVLRHLSSLETLYLSDNKITVIPQNAFSDNHRLKDLDLNINNLTELRPDTFSELIQLRTLTILKNPLPSLPSGLVSEVSSFENVAISLGRLNFSDLEELRRVSRAIFINDLPDIPARAFSSFLQLKVLLISNPRIQAIDENAFEGLTHLEFLLLEGRISSHSRVFSRVSGLKRLYLIRSVSAISEDFFSGLYHLEDLYLPNNELTYLPAGVFHDLHALQKLDLSSNNLTSLPENIFFNLSSLTEINLATNQLSALPPYDPSCVSLQRVSFLNNPITDARQYAIRSWLGDGTRERYVLLSHWSTEVRAEILTWLLSEPELQLGAFERKGRGCGVVRRGEALVRLCVVTECREEVNCEPVHNWIELVRIAARGNVTARPTNNVTVS